MIPYTSQPWRTCRLNIVCKLSEKSDIHHTYLYIINFDFRSPSDDSLNIITPEKKSEGKEVKKVIKPKEITSPVVPEGVVDYDKENLHDPCLVSNYAMDIFNYMKTREKCFKVQDYMPRQVSTSLSNILYHLS